MVIHYKENGKDKKVSGVSWIDISMEDGVITFIDNCLEIDIPLQDVVCITE